MTDRDCHKLIFGLRMSIQPFEVSNQEIEIMSRKAQSTLESLRLAIHGVAAPLSCEGKDAIIWWLRQRFGPD
jgi:hypothetical protein